MSTGSAGSGSMPRRYHSAEDHQWTHSPLTHSTNYNPSSVPLPHQAPYQQQQQQQPHHYLRHSSPAMQSPNPDHSRNHSLNSNSHDEQLDEGLLEAPTTFPELELMSVSELHALNNDNSRFDMFVKNHGFQKHFDQVMGRLQRDIDRLEAEQVRYKQQHHHHTDVGIESKREEEELENKIEELNEKIGKLQKVQDDWKKTNSTTKLIERLNDAIRDSEQLATQLETNMLSKNMDFIDFVREYTACRKLYYERRQKLEQLKLEQRNSIGNEYFGR